MAAVDVLRYCGDRPESDYGLHTTQPWTIGWDEEDTRIRLKFIARAWMAAGTSKAQDAYQAKLNKLPNLAPTWPCRLDEKPLNIPTPKCLPRISQPSDEVADLHDSEALARRHTHTPNSIETFTAASVKKHSDPSLFGNPTMAPPIDFQSGDGFKQAAGKKAKKAAKSAAKAKWGGDEDEDGNKKEDGEGGEGGDKDGDIGAGGDGDKKDEGNGDGDGAGDAPPADDWDSFAPAKSKKKGKKGKTEDPPAAPATEKFDAFHEIKLDDTGPMLDLSFDTGTKASASGFGAWGSSWDTGAKSK